MTVRRILLVMAKQPAPARTKTRLCPPLDPTAAAALYACFLQDTLNTVRKAARCTPGLDPGIAYSPPESLAYFAALAPGFVLVPQTGATLGERLDRVLSGALARGYAHALAINSDSPSLPVAHLLEALRLLESPSIDIVLGPCADGGYYLIGVKAPPGPLVRDVQMSTPRVLEDTLAIAKRRGLRVGLLPMWYDVDSAEELARLRAELALKPASAPRTADFLKSVQDHE